MTVEELQAQLAALGLRLPESDHQPLLGMIAEIERAAAQVRHGLEMSDEMGVIFATDRLNGGAS
ncbi:hypothetical protein [Bradyrhizobium sp. LHD-71]|uniref:hypothetical protein n=1 Tax=Bradyrhizobium sp. LHD-71 TaxID=3072141 RepID=UPI00280E3D56|nr:hypothetical protein [Bradyrhizobium sp. LHD-71]MDQ8727868.1 hypothetical protein [Bradyrhizobium sp. LHD-71]